MTPIYSTTVLYDTKCSSVGEADEIVNKQLQLTLFHFRNHFTFWTSICPGVNYLVDGVNCTYNVSQCFQVTRQHSKSPPLAILWECFWLKLASISIGNTQYLHRMFSQEAQHCLGIYLPWFLIHLANICTRNYDQQFSCNFKMHDNAIECIFTHATILIELIKIWQYGMQYGDRVLVVQSHKIRSAACTYIGKGTL